MTNGVSDHHTEIVVLQTVFNYREPSAGSVTEEASATLVGLREGQAGIVERLDVPSDIAYRLMELGFLPGSTIVAARSAPGGDPQVFRVDGSEIALRRETAARIYLRPASDH